MRAGLRQRAQHPRRRAVHRPKPGRSRRSDRRVQREIPRQDGLDLVRIHLRAARVDGRAGRREAKADRSHSGRGGRIGRRPVRLGEAGHLGQ